MLLGTTIARCELARRGTDRVGMRAGSHGPDRACDPADGVPADGVSVCEPLRIVSPLSSFENIGRIAHVIRPGYGPERTVASYRAPLHPYSDLRNDAVRSGSLSGATHTRTHTHTHTHIHGLRPFAPLLFRRGPFRKSFLGFHYIYIYIYIYIYNGIELDTVGRQFEGRTLWQTT